ncbi:dTDP-4-dehydrorhamnose 3,5-epimerase family protein [Hoeflea ulvae]|uniref:dTDP-4-dehydrorhamnose 3,5-epimerase n=1 Tax=Hoeflea ulvae TaxID=2983764 RepID=A0ABT3YBU1_9HYPH|nr:dTDP-4-dehydrorhamnose 3,5-epimerase [Hoeflea ulvae]MCY0093348.1 dTDP-4-dehydrorhamnose 3,5-epimerase [Hoeflea ulvae]
MSTSPFVITPLLPGAGAATGPALVRRTPLVDDRGAFARIFCAEALAEIGWPGPVAQINHSRTAGRGTVRGLHFQRPPHAEAKLVICIRGAVHDVAVDIRAGSPTRYAHVAAELSAETATAMYVPEGFAHGFQALSDDIELIYVHSAPYTAAAESGLRHDDPGLAIAWPLPVAGISARDASFPLITDAEPGS